MEKKINNLALQVLVLLVLFPGLVSSQELLKTPKPTHTEEGVPCLKLSVFKEINLDYDEDLFFAMPWRITVGDCDRKGGFYFYVYDFKLVKLLIFNEQFKYLGQFLDHGQGPGEVLPNSAGNKDIYAAPNGKLYVSESLENKIIEFSAGGKHIRDIKMPLDMLAQRPFPPVMDEDGFFYIYSTNNGIVDKVDGKMNRVHTYLDKELMARFAIFKPAYQGNKNFHGDYKSPDMTNAQYDITSDGHLLVYLFRSSTFFLFKGEALVRQLDILIDRVLPIHRQRAQKAVQDQKKWGSRIVREEVMFSGFFVDQDEPYFYLKFPDKNGIILYQFDLQGKLVQIFKNIKADVYVKKHGLFFGLSVGGGNKHPIILKKEDSK